MRAEFDFDGERVRLYIKVEDRCEVALAKVIEKFSQATVSLVMPRQEYGYSHRDEDPKGIEIILREAPKCPQTGTWCANGCDQIAGCSLAAQQVVRDGRGDGPV